MITIVTNGVEWSYTEEWVYRQLRTVIRRKWWQMGITHYIDLNDIYQEMALAVWKDLRLMKRLRSARNEKNAIKILCPFAWNLAKVVFRRECHRGLKGRGRPVFVPLPDENADTTTEESELLKSNLDPRGELSCEETRRELKEALAGIDPRKRGILIRHYVKGESLAKIGKAYRRSKQRISQLLADGLREVRIELETRSVGMERNET